MPVARDHKRLLDGDLGPNTGGMGVFAPADDISAAFLERVNAHVFQPFLQQLKKQNLDYCGVIYAGLMIEADGNEFNVLEFNCRFGDPETQVLMALLDNAEVNLVQIMQACIDGKLDQSQPAWRTGYAASVVLAAAGYPDAPQKGAVIDFTNTTLNNSPAYILHAGTALKNEAVTVSGGRVLCVTAQAQTLADTLDACYELAGKINFDGMQYRKDIGKT